MIGHWIGSTFGTYSSYVAMYINVAICGWHSFTWRRHSTFLISALLLFWSIFWAVLWLIVAHDWRHTCALLTSYCGTILMLCDYDITLYYASSWQPSHRHADTPALQWWILHWTCVIQKKSLPHSHSLISLIRWRSLYNRDLLSVSLWRKTLRCVRL